MSRIYQLSGEIFTAARCRELSHLGCREFYRGEFRSASHDRQCNIFLDKIALSAVRLFSFFYGIDMSFRRSQSHIREDGIDVYVIWSITSGSLRFAQSSGVSVIPTGCLTITSSTIPFQLEGMAGNSGFSARTAVVPAHVFRSYVPRSADVIGRPFPVLSGPTRIFRDLTEILYQESESLTPGGRNAILDESLNALSVFAGPETASSPDISATHLRRVKEAIDARLAMNVSARLIARDCRISTQHLHYILRKHGLKFTDMLWLRRLEKAREWLSSQEMASYLISEIAALTGFKRTSHFSRRFSAVYGCTPSTYRARSSAECDAPGG